MLRLPPTESADDLVDRVTDAAWKHLTGLPEFRDLYPGYWVTIRGVVRSRLADPSHGRGRLLALEVHSDLEGFAAGLASAVVCRLEQELRRFRVLELLSISLPRVIGDALMPYVPADRHLPAALPPDQAARLAELGH
ncbi:MAG: hypothetical protein AAB368_02425 [bacterium]